MTARPGIRRGWLAHALAAVVALIALVVGAGAADAAPRLELAARAGRITVLAEPGLARIARELADGAERELDRIARDLVDLPVPKAIEVHLVRDARDLAAVAPAGRGAPPWAIGVAYPDHGVISVAMRRDAAPVDAFATLRHELAHIALGAALGDRAPRWLHEGFAYQHTGEWSWQRAETLAGMAWFGSIIPLDQLDQSFPREELPANRAYAESFDFVGYLSRRGRWEDRHDDGDRWPFRRFLREVARSGDLDAAALHTFGKPLRALFDEWRSDLDNRYMMAPIGLLGLLVWIMCAILLSLAWWRRRRQNRRRLAQWDLEERLRARSNNPPREAEPPGEAAEPAAQRGTGSAQVVAPPYVPWPGEDPLTAEPADDDDQKPDGPRWIN